MEEELKETKVDLESFAENSGKNKVFTKWAVSNPSLIPLLKHLYSEAKLGYEDCTAMAAKDSILFDGNRFTVDIKTFEELIEKANFKVEYSEKKFFKMSTIKISWENSNSDLGLELLSFITITEEELELIYQDCLSMLLEKNRTLVGKLPRVEYEVYGFNKIYLSKRLPYKQRKIVDYLENRGLKVDIVYSGIFSSSHLEIELKLGD